MFHLKSRFFVTIYSLLILLSFASCELSDTSQATVPSYICIPKDSFTFISDSSVGNYQGRNTTYFPDMWVTEKGNLVGATGLPLLLPIIGTGSTLISVDAGILLSGQDNHRGKYPFASTYYQTINLTPGKIDTIKPVFKYLNNTNFKLIVDYDRPMTSRGFELNPTYTVSGDTLIQVNDAGSREPGNTYFKVKAKGTSKTYQMITSDQFTLPNLGAPVFIELDYKSDINFEIGYYYAEPNQPTSSAIPFIELIPTGTWKKVYLDLTAETAPRKTGTAYRFYIGYYSDSGKEPDISFDNFKILSLD